ncbi:PENTATRICOPEPTIDE REPEAT-CONTAINING PROTEIN [Salix purpurea]|uniref:PENTATRICOPEPTIDE REPEAT-CONTAINING PROTEIN n=1 Tax=Salix purpurea TaxID=77065 RepID=A0A9Q0Q2P5_SALPP|nr:PENTATRICOPEPTIDE REPEAT-CONTAINING PROTEIN [Salix purpurea]
MVLGNEPKFDLTSVIAVLPAVAELQELKLGMQILCLAIKCGFTCNGETEDSVKLFKELLGSGERVSSSTIVGLIPVYSPFGHSYLCNCIHGFCVKYGIVSHSSVSTALTTVYCRLNEMILARQLFDESAEKTLASWNAMISGYTQNGLTEAAISLFQTMQKNNVNPNPVTVTSILSACAQIGALSLGEWNEVTWNAMISGYGLHGHGQEALKLFYEMLSSSVKPTSYYVLMSNIYSVERKYPQAASVRQVAKKKRLVKTPGCTLIEIGQVALLNLS